MSEISSQLNLVILQWFGSCFETESTFSNHDRSSKLLGNWLLTLKLILSLMVVLYKPCQHHFIVTVMSKLITTGF